VAIPVIACGGAGKVVDVHEVIAEGRADAVSMASVLHYSYIREHYTENDYSTEGNVEFLRGQREFSSVRGATLAEIKRHLRERNIPCRSLESEGSKA
jgi:cyclase